jgi:hypothetical protein
MSSACFRICSKYELGLVAYKNEKRKQIR